MLKDQEKKYRMDADGNENPLLYKFSSWGWLGNEYLKTNNYKLPSWSQLKDAIIREQIIVAKDEQREFVKRRMAKGIASHVSRLVKKEPLKA